MALYILIAAVIIIICLTVSKFSSKIGVPVLLAFIFLGMLFGCDGIFKIQFDDFSFAETICSVSLIFIMFYGGFGTNWKKAKKVAAKSVLLSTLGVVLTAGITGLFCFFVLKFDLLESMLIGAVISSTDAASVFSILRSKRLNLKYNTASLLEVESGSNDPCAYMMTVIILTLMSGKTSGIEILYMIFAQIVFGAAIGVATVFLAYFMLKRMNFGTNGFESILVFAMALVSWSGLRGAASIVFAIMAVVSPAYLKNDVFHVVFFIVLFSISIQGTLIPFVAKRLDMIDNKSDVMKTFNDYTKEVPVQFIKLPIDKKHPWTNKKVCNIHFLPNTILALIIREDKQIVPRGNTTLLAGDIAVLSGPSLEKKFTGHLTEIEIDADSEWIGMALSEIDLDSDKLVTLIKRGKRIVIPSGKTVVKENDVLIINKTQK